MSHLPPLPEEGHCPEETARLSKDGHTVFSKSPDFLPAASLSWHAPSKGQKLRPKPVNRHRSSWRCSGGTSQHRTSLYRSPTLPVYQSSVSNGTAVCIQKYLDDTRDWRKLQPEDIAKHFSELQSSMTDHALHGILAGIRSQKQHGIQSDALQQVEGLVSAVAIGTLQACDEKAYWSPSYPSSSSSTSSMLVSDLRAPMSRLYQTTPDISTMPKKEDVSSEIKVRSDLSPLAACQRLASTGSCRRVALVRFTPSGDVRGLNPSVADHRESQLFMQTTYLHALQDMNRHLHTDPMRALESGGLIYTSDVALVRGSLEEGSPWLPLPVTFDVLWVSLQRNPRTDDQGQYSRIEEKALAASTIDRIFACAASNDADALVFPPPGIGGASGCRHPGEDAGDMLRKAAMLYSKQVPTVWACQEYPGQVHGVWDGFAAAVVNFRKPIEHRELVPVVASPYIRPGWEAKRKLPPKRVRRLPWPLREDAAIAT